MGTRDKIRAIILVPLALVLTVLVGEAIHELHYADVHPGAYGPAKVIALACGAGAVVALALGLAILTLTPAQAVRRWRILAMIVVAVVIGVWLVTLSAQAPAGSSGGFGTGIPSL